MAEVIVGGAGPSGSGCRRPGSWRSTSTRPSPATRPTRRSRTCSTPARAQPRHRLPARRVRVRRPCRPADGDATAGPGALAGRVRRQRRPLLAQPQPAAVARRPVGDRPRRRALLPPRLVRWSRRPGALRAPGLERRRPRVPRARGRPARDRRRAARLPGRAVFADVLAEVPDEWLEPVPGADDRRRCGRRTSTSSPPGLGDRPVASPGSGHDGASSLPTSTSSCAASRGSTARSS